jgi:HlyD family secretion protein
VKQEIQRFLLTVKEKLQTRSPPPRWRVGIGIFIFLVALLSIKSCYSPNYIQGFVDYKTLYVASRAAGKLENIPVSKGMWVEKDALLFALESSPESDQVVITQALLRQAQSNLINAEKGSRETILEGLRAEIERSQAALALSEITEERYTRLYAVGAVEKATLDAAVTDTEVKRAQLVEAQAQLAESELGDRVDIIRAQADNVANFQAQLTQATWELEQKTLFAPTRVLVLDTFYQNGEFVIAGRPVVSLLDPNKVYAVIYVNEPILSKIKLGETVYVTHDRAHKKYPATVTFISNTAEYTPPVIYSRENNQQLVFRVEATFAPELVNEFHPGQPVDVYW